MSKILKRWWGRIAIGTVLVLGLTYAFWPRPITVEMGAVTRGPMAVAIEDDGQARVREVYTVSAPFAARVMRIEGEAGDAVSAGETVLANLLPSTPAFLDIRTRSELEAAEQGAEAALAQAEAEVDRIVAERDLARVEYDRYRNLAERGTASRAQLDRAVSQLRALEAALVEARAARDVAEFETERARAALMGPDSPQGQGDAGAPEDAAFCCFALPAPVSGRILKVHQKSETVVTAGTPLMDIGDPSGLEIVVDFLSTDAVQVSSGDPVRIERWGGPDALNGVVRRVEPFGFTKISALGIEEQRVNVIMDLTDPQEKWARLGHGYRIEAAVILWEDDNALRVPVSALFRENGQWTVFAVQEGRARAAAVEIGHMNDRHGEVLGGLAQGDRVILHPGERIADGGLVAGPGAAG